MKKTIALVLVLALLVNCVAWAETTEAEETFPAWVVVVGLVGVLVLCGWAVMGGLAIADEPDNGLRLASMPGSQVQPETDTGAVLRALQHVDLGVTADNKTYLGLRFQF